MEGFSLFSLYRELAVNTYHVDPFIFILLMIISVPFYYWGWFALLKSIVRYIKEDKKERSLEVIFRRRNFLIPLTVNRVAWVGPYLYVIFWGENIPLTFWIIFLGWIIFSGIIFFIKLKEKIKKGDIDGKRFFL